MEGIAKMRDRIAKMREGIAKMRERFTKMREGIAKMRDKIAKMRDKIGKKRNKMALFLADKAIISKEPPANSIQFRSNSVRMDFCKIIYPEKRFIPVPCNIAACKISFMKIISLSLFFAHILKKTIRFQKLIDLTNLSPRATVGIPPTARRFVESR